MAPATFEMVRKRTKGFESFVELTGLVLRALEAFHPSFLPDRVPMGLWRCVYAQLSGTAIAIIRFRDGHLILVFESRLGGMTSMTDCVMKAWFLTGLRSESFPC
jgi:hypothetical protein